MCTRTSTCTCTCACTRTHARAHAQVRVASAHTLELFNVTRGDIVTAHPNTHDLWGAGANVATQTFDDYAHTSPEFPQLAAPQSGVLVRAEYDVSSAAYVAQLQPFAHTGNVDRLRRVLAKLERGEPLTVAVLGGSISAGSTLGVHNRKGS